jgi:hypothetical protein
VFKSADESEVIVGEPGFGVSQVVVEEGIGAGVFHEGLEAAAEDGW